MDSDEREQVFSNDITKNYDQRTFCYYPREFEMNEVYLNKTFTDGESSVTFDVIGVPDGVSPLATEAIVKEGTVKRMFIYSKTPITKASFFTAIDNFCGKIPYPQITCKKEQGIPLGGSLPRENFYICSEYPPTTTSSFIEYRYLKTRNSTSKIVFDHTNHTVFKMVLPEQPFLCILMPKNFVQTGLRQGYFRFENNLIVNVFSKYTLVSRLRRNESVHTTDLSIVNVDKIQTLVNNLFVSFGMHKIVTELEAYNHIYAYDGLMTMVVGNVSNLVLT